ncbi:MAG: SGNH/GDSL hydrolase family protein [Steroidobacteraceae bacterium]
MRRGIVLAGLLVAWLPALAGAAAGTDRWLASWAASPQQAMPGPQGDVPDLSGRTLRQRVRLTAGGTRLRLRLSNEYGAAPLSIGAVTIAAPASAADGAAPANAAAPGAEDVRAGSVRALTFGGRASVVIPPGAPVLSDPVEFEAPRGRDVIISVYFPSDAKAVTLHSVGLSTAVISPPGDFTHDAHAEAASTTTARLLLSAVLVPAAKDAIGIVALGDSITDGTRSSVDANRRWPDVLARRFAAQADARSRVRGGAVGIANEGISGNRLLADGAGASALARLDRDVLALPGVTHVIVLIGINDIGWPGAKWGERFLEDPARAPALDDLAAAYRQIIDRVHGHGAKVIGATLTPFEGTDLPGYYSTQKESLRQTVNRWIRNGGAFDGVIDFDAALRDPAHPAAALPGYMSDDHIHPSDAGYDAMGQAVALELFR